MATKKKEVVADEVLQTDTTNPEIEGIHHDTPPQGAPEESSVDQTGSKPKKTTRRRKKDANAENQSGETDKNAAESSSDGVPERPKAKKKAYSVKPGEKVVSIEDRPTVRTDADKANDDLLDLLESLKVGRILTGTIEGVEFTEKHRPLAVTYHGEFKVIIPVDEAVVPPDDFGDRKPDEVLYALLNKRIGAEIDYIIKGIDSKTGLAVASRLEAMKSRRKQYYFGTDRDGNNILYAGVCAEARVVSTVRAGIFVDLFGVEVYIPLRELSYQRMMDASAYFQPGQRILVKILDVERGSKDVNKVKASVKQASENPYEKALRKYTINNRYVGTVSMVDANGVFVALDGGIDCLCSYPKRGRPPRGARATVRILGINYQTNRIWGVITHISATR